VKKIMSCSLVFATLFVSDRAISNQENQSRWIELQGRLKIVEGVLGDELPEKNKANKNIYIVVKGDAAKAMYRSLQSPVLPNLCGEKNTVYKENGGVVCFKRKNRYQCDFSIDPSGTSVKLGLPC
jgi:hypothetical protein